MSRSAVVQSHLEALMQQVLEVEELKVTDQGTINVSTEVAGYTARLRKNREEPHIEVYSVAISGIAADPGLFEALNDANRTLSHCRIFWESEEQVVVAGELLGASADVASLACLCEEVAWVADHGGPRLAEIFGGRTGEEDA